MQYYYPALYKIFHRKIGLIIAIATPAAAGAAAVTEEIPIVFSALTNPVEDFQIESL